MCHQLSCRAGGPGFEIEMNGYQALFELNMAAEFENMYKSFALFLKHSLHCVCLWMESVSYRSLRKGVLFLVIRLEMMFLTNLALADVKDVESLDLAYTPFRSDEQHGKKLKLQGTSIWIATTKRFLFGCLLTQMLKTTY